MWSVGGARETDKLAWRDDGGNGMARNGGVRAMGRARNGLGRLACMVTPPTWQARVWGRPTGASHTGLGAKQNPRNLAGPGAMGGEWGWVLVPHKLADQSRLANQSFSKPTRAHLMGMRAFLLAPVGGLGQGLRGKGLLRFQHDWTPKQDKGQPLA